MFKHLSFNSFLILRNLQPNLHKHKKYNQKTARTSNSNNNKAPLPLTYSLLI